ncbi:hypothetical protein V1L52_11820 [Treponema sp. HNW]|uniref:hypothetical protein n=1 Tax=Treponema sp. HNW TaxID=3116654 RepID=UPI003D130BC2
MDIKVKSSASGTLQVYRGQKKIFEIKNRLAAPGDSIRVSETRIEGGIAGSVFCGCIQTTAVKPLSPDYFKIEHTWTFTSGGEKNISSVISLPAEKAELFIPSVLFKKNEKGTGCFYKGGIEQKFTLYEDRTPLPGCTVLADTKRVIISCLDNPSKAFDKGASVSSFTKGKKAVCAFYYPGNETPFSYQGKTRTVSPARKKSYVRIPECSETKPYVIKRSRYLYIGAYKTEQSSAQGIDYNAVFDIYRDFIETHTAHTHKKDITENVQHLFDWDNWFTLKKRHLLFLTETPHESASLAYIKMGKENGAIQDVYEFTGASFLIKSIEAAFVFSETGDPALAEKIGNFFLQAENPPFSGIFKDNHNLKTGEWGGYLGIAEDKTYGRSVNARCNGEAMTSYIRLYESLLKQGIKRDDFIALAKRVAFFYVKHQLKNGSFGRWWSAEGRVVNKDGTNGAYIVSLLIMLLPYCTDEEAGKCSEALKKAAVYYTRLIDKADFYGDTLDADACDKESAVILLRISLDLYTYTGDKAYIQSARKAANFILTWTWFYNVRFPPASPLGKVRFLTAGMTSVSTAHHHLDFYGMYIARDFFRLSRVLDEKDGDFYDKSARLMMNACRQLIACEKMCLGKSSALEGWQPEQINHTVWDYFDRSDRQKGFFDVCIAWVPVLTLGAYLSIKSEFPEKLV